MSEETETLTAKELELVEEYLLEDPARIALKLHGKADVDGQKVAQQILARQKARLKLPNWYENKDLIFPAPLSVEQASSQATARYKASLISGSHLADLTLGMGVDTYYLSKNFPRVTGYEVNPHTAAITARNLKTLGANHVQVINAPAEKAELDGVDHIFVDPSRRDSQKRKVYAFEDSSPNVVELLPSWLHRNIRVTIKSSPIVDLDLAVKQLENVSEVHVVGYQKECKEIVFLINPSKAADASPDIHAVVVNDQGEPFHQITFTAKEEHLAAVEFGTPTGFLYEPHPAFMKSGCFNLMASAFGLQKVAKNSHLYYSENKRTDFPGRLFQIREVLNASDFKWQNWLKEGKANLTVRNFPANPDDLRKKWRLKEGGQDYLFATTLSSGRKVVILTEKPGA